MMTTWILNSAVLPGGEYGTYDYRPATWDEMREALDTAPEGLVSCVGYPETRDLIARQAGVDLPLNRGLAAIAEGDVAYVVRLRDRVVDPAAKGAPTGARDEDWEVARVERLRGSADGRYHCPTCANSCAEHCAPGARALIASRRR